MYYICTRNTKELQRSLKIAKIAQLVERDLAKVEVAGSSPVFRSKIKIPIIVFTQYNA
jgi:hypothetical protein